MNGGLNADEILWNGLNFCTGVAASKYYPIRLLSTNSALSGIPLTIGAQRSQRILVCSCLIVRQLPELSWPVIDADCGPGFGDVPSIK